MMRRYDVLYALEARNDLAKIFAYILEVSQSLNTAERFVDRIMARCIKIGNIPFGGRPRDDLMIGLRTVPFEKATIIAYRVVDDTVMILNVFHGGRDYEALYRGDDDVPPSG